MPNSWDEYYNHYTDWDEAHCFNVRINVRYEDQIKSLGYEKVVFTDELFTLDKQINKSYLPQNMSYQINTNEILLSFDVPYDWSIDNDWEDRALSLLGLQEEWVIDYSVEDY